MPVACAQIVDAGFAGVSLDRPYAPAEPGLDAAEGSDDSTGPGGSAGAPDANVEGNSDAATNTAPEARDGTLVVVEGARKRSRLPSFDADGDAREHQLVRRAELGEVTIDTTTGDFEYVSRSGAYGDDSFTYQVSDRRANAAGTIKVTVVARGPLRAESGPVVTLPTTPGLWIGEGLDIEGDTAAMSAWEYGSSLVYVMRRDASGSWRVRQRIDEGLTRNRITDVGLSGDWMAVVVSGSKVEWGTAYFYKRPSNNADFGFRQKIIADSLVEDVGRQIALDGDLAVISAPNDPSDTLADGGFAQSSGAAYIYRRQFDDVWTRERKIVAPSPEQELNFGRSLGIASGALVTTAVSRSSVGATVYVFNQREGTWTMGNWFAADPEPFSGYFAKTVAADDDKVLVSCSGLPNSLYAFARNGSGWQARGLVELPVGEAIINDRGATVALHDDIAIITLRLRDEVGAGYVYHYSSAAADSGWRYSGRKLTGAEPGRNGLGFSDAFDGTTAVLTAPDESNARGAIYFFGIEPHGKN